MTARLVECQINPKPHPLDDECQTAADTHCLEVVSGEQVKRGRRIRYRCPDCDAKGDFTVSPAAKAGELFEMPSAGHKASENNYQPEGAS